MSNELITDVTAFQAGTWHSIELPPAYPFTISVPPDVTITLFADGKWEGSIEGLRQALATRKADLGDGMSRIMLWLILREMERDARFW